MSQDEIKETRIYKTTTSFSHILGNITSIIEKYIKDVMPNDFFRTTRATTEVGFKDHMKSRSNMIQTERPYLILDPRFLTNDESPSLPRINWDKFVPVDPNSGPQFYSINSEFFLKDEVDQVSLGYTFNRYRLVFRILMLVDTQMIRLSLVNYLRSNFRFRSKFPIERYAETLIPKSYMSYLATKFDLTLESNDFMQKINQLSAYPIARLYRPATGQMEFFILSMTTIELYLPDYPTEDRLVVARIEQYSSVEFNIEVELNVMNNFLLTTSDFVDNPDEMMTDYMFRLTLESNTPVMDNIRAGRTLYTKLNVEFEPGTEVVDLNPFFGRDITDQIKYIKDHGLTNPYVEIVIFKWQNQIDIADTTLVEIDFAKLHVTLKQLEAEVTYRIFIYFDMPFLASITKFINDATINHEGTEYST
jgi:hypothetical protein